MPVKLLIFDLDGTLVDTSTDIANALNYALKPHGLKPLSVKDTVGMVGEGITRLIEKLLGEENAHLKEDVLKKFLHYYSDHLSEHSTAYPEVRETLRKLHNVKKAVISNKREFLSRKLLEELGLAGHFDIVVGSDTVPEKKPSAMPVLHVLSSLGISAEDSLIIGDSNYDIEAGRKAGLKTVAVTYGYKDPETLKHADCMIDSMGELVELLYDIEVLSERRKEKRYTVPDIYQKYIELKIEIAGDYIQANLLDLSEHGIKIKSPVPLEAGSLRECTLAIPKSLSREIAFTARIRHCFEQSGEFIAGAEIEEVEDTVWFRIFKKVHDFISERAGDIF